MAITFSIYGFLIWIILASIASAQDESIGDVNIEEVLFERQNYQFVGALAIYGSGSGTYSGSQNGGYGAGSTAVPAQCPADHPVSCSAIQEPYYCCPAGNYCAWSDSVVSCCPSGQTCYAQGSTWQPTTTWAPAATTVYVAGGGYESPAASTVHEGYVGYCSTLVEQGPNLPTTAAGECGTILVVEAEAIQASVIGWTRLTLMIVGLQAIGGALFLWA